MTTFVPMVDGEGGRVGSLRRRMGHGVHLLVDQVRDPRQPGEVFHRPLSLRRAQATIREEFDSTGSAITRVASVLGHQMSDARAVSTPAIWGLVAPAPGSSSIFG